jgi:hypothetical protein
MGRMKELYMKQIEQDELTSRLDQFDLERELLVDDIFSPTKPTGPIHSCVANQSEFPITCSDKPGNDKWYFCTVCGHATRKHEV